MICLLYADDVVLIDDQYQMVNLLKLCEDYSYSLGHRWNPSKCVTLDPTDQPLTYTLYGDVIPTHPSFFYLGIPFRPGEYLDTIKLPNVNINKVLATMNQLSVIRLHPKRFKSTPCRSFLYTNNPSPTRSSWTCHLMKIV